MITTNSDNKKNEKHDNQNVVHNTACVNVCMLCASVCECANVFSSVTITVKQVTQRNTRCEIYENKYLFYFVQMYTKQTNKQPTHNSSSHNRYTSSIRFDSHWLSSIALAIFQK